MNKNNTTVMKLICIIGWISVGTMTLYMTSFNKQEIKMIPSITILSSMTILELLCIYRYGVNTNKYIQVWLPIIMIITYIFVFGTLLLNQ